MRNRVLIPQDITLRGDVHILKSPYLARLLIQPCYQTNHSSFCVLELLDAEVVLVVCDKSGPNCLYLLGTIWDGLWWPSSIICVEYCGTLMVPQGDASFPTSAMLFDDLLVKFLLFQYDVCASKNHSFP